MHCACPTKEVMEMDSFALEANLNSINGLGRRSQSGKWIRAIPSRNGLCRLKTISPFIGKRPFPSEEVMDSGTVIAPGPATLEVDHDR